MTLLNDLKDWKLDTSTKNVLYDRPGVPVSIYSSDVVSQNITIDLIYNRKVSELLADNPDSTEQHLQSIAGWVEEDPFIKNGSAVVTLEKVSLNKQNIIITADLNNEAEINLVIAI